jgi:hypothetical protein
MRATAREVVPQRLGGATGKTIRWARALAVVVTLVLWGAGASLAVAAPIQDEEDVCPATEEPAPTPPPAPADSTETPPPPPREPTLPPVSASRDGKRAVPDYAGRAPPPPTAGQVLIWVPRVLLAPALITAEYGIRRPVVGLIRWGQEHYVFKRIYDLFTWDDGQGGVYPIANIDLGLKQTVGLALFSHRLIAPANSLSLSVSFSTQGVFSTSFQDRLRVFRDGAGTVYLGGHFTERPDGIFYGTGADTRNEDKTFYSFVSRGLSLGLASHLGGLNQAIFEIETHDVRFSPSHLSASTPSLDARYGGPDQPPLPNGWGGYGLVKARAALIVDTRSTSFESAGTGLRFEAGAGYALDPGDSGLQFVPWGAALAVFYDFSGARHVIALETATQFVERIGARGVPFTELPTLGGLQWMRGFLGGRLRGDSSFTTTLLYRYPVASFLEGELFSSLGNTFAGHLQGFEPGRLFLNWGMGLRTTFARDASITVTLALASNRLDAPQFDPVDATRVSFGVIHGF